jgi:hypothetical protein
MENQIEQGGLYLAKFGDRKIINGVECEYVDSGYTLREYYAHHTQEKGPGPGWDTRDELLNNDWAMKNFGRTFKVDDVYQTAKSTPLPDLPLGHWYPVEK